MSRFFPNQFLDYPGPGCVVDPVTTQVHHHVREQVLHQAQTLLSLFEQQLQPQLNWRDFSVYTGIPGISMLYLKMARSELMAPTPQQRIKYIDKGIGYLYPYLAKLRAIKVPTFMCGEVGPIVVGSILYYEKNILDECDRMLMKLVSILNTVTDVESGEVPDEILYGRAGYLYGLLFAQHMIPNQRIITQEIVRKVVEAILASGMKTAAKEGHKTPLFYYWYGEPYLGAAHGLAGILYLLLQSGCLTQAEIENLIKPSIDYVLSLQLRSGNFPPCTNETSDHLVHWCHGAPGIVHLFSLAYGIFRDERYLDAALKCGEVIWQRGLLRKGYSLCHGTAGNAYGFLSLYQLTRDEKHLYRALKFAEWCFDYGKHGCRTPDNPVSLFEGMAGTVFFLTDLLNPLEARFPAFQF